MITFMQMIDINIDITITTAATEATTATEANNNNNNNNNNNGAAGEPGEAGEGNNNNNNNNNPRSLYPAGEFTQGQSWKKLFFGEALILEPKILQTNVKKVRYKTNKKKALIH